MVSAERVMAYGKLEPEASLETNPDSSKPPPDWPYKGLIELSDVTYRHSPEGPQVLKGISATILPSEKVGTHYTHVCLYRLILCNHVFRSV